MPCFPARAEVSENGSTSCVTIVPPPMNAYFPTVQNWCTGTKRAHRRVILNRHMPRQRRRSSPGCSGCPQSCHARYAHAAISRLFEPTRVMPPPFTVPRLMVTYSRMVFSSPISVSRRLAAILQILRRHSHRAKRMKHIPRADPRVSIQHHMRNQPCSLRPAPHPARSSKTAPRRRNREPPPPAPPPHWDECSLASLPLLLRIRLSMRAFLDAPASPPRTSAWPGRPACHRQYAVPSIRPARVLNDSTSTSIRNWSPGVTGRRNLARSIPVNTTSFELRSSISCHHDDAASLRHRLHHQHARA